MATWTQKLKPLLNLFLQSQCPLCQRLADRELCADCWQQLQRCQIRQPQLEQESPPVFSWGVYGGALKRSIAALKYDNQPQLARPLGQWLGQAWITAAPPIKPVAVVPIPMHIAKQQQRGYNQADLLAEAFCQVTRLPLQQGLERVRATEAQFGLAIGAREQNLTGAFQLGKDFLRRPPSGAVLLLDDIYTTGATVRAATQSLKQHQIAVCGVVAIARPVKGLGTHPKDRS